MVQVNLLTLLKRLSLLFVLIYVSWQTVSRIIFSSRGLDLSDEGLYLLAASNSDLEKSLGSPWGWHVRPLYLLAGENIANFRTLGGVIILLLAAILGSQLAITKCAGCSIKDGFCTSKFMKFSFIASSILSALYFYSGMLRTPSYNWVAVVGLYAVSIGFVKVLRFGSVDGMEFTKTAIAWMSFGLFFMIPGRPAAALFLLCLIFVLFFFNFGIFKSFKLTLSVIACISALIGTAILLKLWDRNPVEVFGNGFKMPAFFREQTPIGAIEYFLRVPSIFFETLMDNSGRTKSLLWTSIVIGMVAAWFLKYSERLLLLSFFVWTLGSLSASNIPILIGPNSPTYLGWASASITESSLLFLVGTLLFFNRSRYLEKNLSLRARRSTHAKSKSSEFKTKRKTEEFARGYGPTSSLRITFLLLAPFTIGLGAAAGPFRMAGLVSGFFVLASICLVQRYHSRTSKLTRTTLLLVILVFVTTSSAWSVTSGKNNPWGTSFKGSVRSIEVGNSQGKLDIPEETAQILTVLKESAIQNGWTKDTPIIDLSWPWNPGIIFALQGGIPSSIIFGTTSDTFSEQAHLHNLKLDANRLFIKDAWILLSTSEVIPESFRTRHSNIVRDAELVLAKKIERDFISVVNINGLTLLKPR